MNCGYPFSSGALAHAQWNLLPNSIASCLVFAGQPALYYEPDGDGGLSPLGWRVGEGPTYFLFDEVRSVDGKIYLGTVPGNSERCAYSGRLFLPAAGMTCYFRDEQPG